MPSATNNGTNGHTDGVNGHPKSALCTIDEFLAHSYDYLIIGGGTVGLCVAARLTEDPNITVGVLDSGENRLDDKNVLTPSLFPTLPGKPEYDWMESIPQPTAVNKVYSMPRGKMLGGSSGNNYLMYMRGSRKGYYGWRELSNEGWGWDNLKEASDS